jgi:hypothetical protein
MPSFLLPFLPASHSSAAFAHLRSLLVSSFGYIFVALSLASAMSGQVLIDDTNGDEITGLLPTYEPPNGWASSPCKGCGIQPNSSLAGSGTWHDTTANSPDVPRSVTLQFNGKCFVHPTFSHLNWHLTGTGIDVYCIMGNQIPWITTSMRISFILDGKQLPEFTRQPDQTEEIYYNRRILNIDSLTPGLHKLKMSAIATSSDDSGHSAFLFDYALYTCVHISYHDSNSQRRQTASAR